MKRTAFLGYTLLLMVLFIPHRVWAQADVDAYTAFYAEGDAQKKAAMGEKFITDFKTSQYTDAVFRTIVPIYVKSSNWPKVLDLVGKLEQLVPAMTPQNKAVMYSQGMN